MTAIWHRAFCLCGAGLDSCDCDLAVDHFVEDEQCADCDYENRAFDRDDSDWYDDWEDDE